MTDCNTSACATFRILFAMALSLIFLGPNAVQAAAPAGAFVNTLMPQPKALTAKSGGVTVSSSFRYALQGNQGQRVSQAALRFVRQLEMRTGVQIELAPAADATGATLTIDVRDAHSAPYPALGMDESYTLDADATQIVLRANSDFGALRGLETLLQLVQPQDGGFVIPAVHIEDSPRFPWRGLMLDCGRHFLPVEVIYRTLDGMAAVKLNVFHWHLTEDQGFRIESRVYPKLQELGSNGLYYTQQQVRDIIAYAAARGIRVVPEFDMPGHSTSWMVGYPDLGSAPGPYSVQTRFGIHDAALDPTRESTYRFLDRFIGEMAALFPDTYMHIGGDESNGKQWKANPHIQAFMKAHGMTTTQELQAYFNQRVEKILAKHHKHMVGWDEILNPKLPQNAVIQVWHGDEFLINSAKQGHHEIYSRPYYLDHTYTAAQMFAADPVPAGADLTAAQAQLILGGEACMWGEQISPTTIDSRIWPRTAAVAERLWSPATDRDPNDLYRRLGVESLRLEAVGLTHISGPQRRLRALAGREDDRALALFAATLQPVDFQVRSRLLRATQLTPYDRLVDAVRPDPPLRHQVELLVNAALRGDAGAARQLQAIFQSWVNAAPMLQELAANSPLLQQDSRRMDEWPQLGTAGLEALKFLSTRSAPPTDWQQRQKQLLQEAGRRGELVEFAVLPSLQKLIDAVEEAPAGAGPAAAAR